MRNPKATPLFHVDFAGISIAQRAGFPGNDENMRSAVEQLARMAPRERKPKMDKGEEEKVDRFVALMFEENMRCIEFLHTESGTVEHQFYLVGHELLGMLQHGRLVLTPEIRSLIRSDPAEALQQRVPGNNVRRR